MAFGNYDYSTLAIGSGGLRMVPRRVSFLQQGVRCLRFSSRSPGLGLLFGVSFRVWWDRGTVVQRETRVTKDLKPLESADA